MKAVNLFEKAAVVPAKGTTKGKKEEKPSVQVDGLEDYAVVDFLIKKLEGLKSTLKAPVEECMRTHFIHFGPHNYYGKDRKAKASMQYKKRSSASALNDTEIALCASLGIETVEVSDRPETYVINPAYKDDTELLAKVSKALVKVPGLPADFLMFQESTKKIILTDDAQDKVFAMDKDVIEIMLNVVGTIVIGKPTLDMETEEVMVRVQNLLTKQEEEE